MTLAYQNGWRTIAAALLAAAPLLPAQAQTAQDIGDTAADVAIAPARDLNLAGDDVPEILAALRSPYQPVADPSCTGIGGEIAALDAVLGPDADVPPAQDDGDALDRVGEVASSVVGSLLLPFRGLVRQISGARARDRRLLAAHIRGVTRRSYLKGIGEARGCRTPASPSGYIPPIETGDDDGQSEENR